ncbi:DinB family protein [Solimonas sp. SE-A11]|uniref:DinB family protein n=1 Tax=Solimonas sp. SE-A11 TaxID=3054954 RepID=UPI00259D12A8|nr:DinB family protein [Solimonas sp. SE-A11]MDM4772688.1 DinB family protein [Solimonas sp. SE-A11]
MISRDWCRRMARYNHWMNQKLYDAAAQLSEAQRQEDRGAFFKSLHATLDHLVYADTAWLYRFTGRDISVLDPRKLQYTDFATLRAARERLDAEILAWVETVDENWLAAPFSATGQLTGKTFTRPAWQMVSHVFNHQTHHRGQATTLLMQFGIDPGVTDLAALPD